MHTHVSPLPSAACCQDSRLSKVRKTEASDTAASAASSSAAAASASSASASAPPALPPLDLTGLEGADLLSADEKKLCSELRLLPQHYFVVKERLIREAFLRGILKPGQARQLIKIGASSFVGVDLPLCILFFFLIYFLGVFSLICERCVDLCGFDCTCRCE
jgi:hypothetical protein